MSSVCVLCLAECPAAGGVCSGCEVELRAWLQWRARLTHLSPPHTAHRTLRVLLTRLPPPRGPQSHHQPHTSTGIPLSIEKQEAPPAKNPKHNPPCPKCGTQLPTRSGLLLHLHYKHNIPRSECKNFIPKIRCDICNKQFKIEYKLNLHTITHHKVKQYRPFPCDKCEKRFVTSTELKSHDDTKHSEPTFHCNLCDKKFYLKYYLQYHITNVHLTAAYTHICPLCGKALKSAHSLKSHKQNVHSIRKFKCSKCGSVLKSKTNLREHEKYIHGPRNEIFPCSLCRYTTHCKRHLRNHMRDTHSSVNYKCSQCKKCYKSKGNLKRHVRRQHSLENHACEKFQNF